MDTLVTIIPNSSPAFIAQPNYDEDDNIYEIDLEHITAWKVIYVANVEDNNSSTIPITPELGLPEMYAIYYTDTQKWQIPHHRSGHGLDSLTEYFKDETARKNCLI
ncbi:MAG: hypothetical protein RPT25_06725 [Cycloclasticus sp.]